MISLQCTALWNSVFISSQKSALFVLTSLSKTSGLRTIHTSPTISGLKTVINFLKNVKVFKMLKKDYQSYLCIFYSRYAWQIHHYLR